MEMDFLITAFLFSDTFLPSYRDGPACHIFSVSEKKCFLHKDLKMDLLTTKIVTMSILGSVSLLIGFIPMLVAKKVSFD